MTNEPSNAERLALEHSKAIYEASLQKDKWHKLKKEYEDLKDTLTNLPKKLKHDVMVPFGSVGMFPGKLVHTNEIMVLLGDNWFAQCTSHQATAIIERRIKIVEQKLKDFDGEISFLESRKQVTEKLKAMDKLQDVVEIREESEEDISKPVGKRRVAHKSTHNVTERSLKDTEMPRKIASATEGNKDNTVDKLFARLDELELEETRSELEKHNMKMEILNADNEVRVRFKESSLINEEKVRGTGSDLGMDGEENCIRFRHTYDVRKEHGNQPSDEESQDSDPVPTATDVSTQKFVSPADIYNHFAKPLAVDVEEKPLKSILKKERKFSGEGIKPKPILKHSPDHKSDGSSGDELIVTPAFEEPKPILKTGSEVISGTVVERDATVLSNYSTNESQTKKKVSRFKASRMKK